MGSSYTARAIPVNKRGSDCSGTDGAVNRTLQIDEGPLLDSAMIYVGGRFLHPDDEYDLNENIITFLINIDDTDTIRMVLGR